MRLTHLACKNIKGFEGDFALDLGDVNVAAGSNGTNKTSFLSLITGLFGKGNPRMLRNGSESGEIRAAIEHEDERFEVIREFTPGKVKTPKVNSSRTGPLGAPATFLKQLIDAVSVDPINEAMNASEERQCEILLETMPMDLEEGAIEQAVSGVTVPREILAKAAKSRALDAIRLVSDSIYNQRTDVNRDAKLKRDHASELLKAPGMDEANAQTDWGGVAASLSQQLQDLAAEEARLRVEAEKEYALVKQHLEHQVQEAEDEIDADIDAQIAKLNEQRNQRKKDLQAQRTAKLEAVAKAHQENLASITTDLQPRRDQITADHAIAQQNASMAERVRQTIALADRNRREADELAAKAKTMTAALESLDGVRQKLLEKLPIRGLSIEAGVPYLDGVPLSEVNTQKRMQFWVRVAAMRAKDLGIVCMDGAEAFDDQHMQALVAAAGKTGLQWFIGRVDSRPFRIEQYEAAA